MINFIRFKINGNMIVPVVDGSTVYTNLDDFLLLGSCVAVAGNMYPGNVDNRIFHAMNWIKQKRGIRCKKVGGFIAEYNFRYFLGEGDIGNRFLTAMQSVYEHINA